MSQYHARSGRVIARTERHTNAREGSIQLGDDFTIGFWERTEAGPIDAWSHATFDGEPISATFPDLQAVVDAFAAGLDRER